MSVCFLFVVLILILEVSTQRSNKIINLNFQQSDYKMDFQRVELASYNKQLVSYFDVVTFKYNRTFPAVNFTFSYKFEPRNELEIITQAYKFMSNEYRYFPIRLEVNMCNAIKQNTLGLKNILHCGTFHGCPLQKNTRYHICYFAPDQRQFPPLIPTGEYMLEFQALYRSMEVFVLRGYGKVHRPIEIP